MIVRFCREASRTRDGHSGVTVGQGDGLGLAACVSGKGPAHAHILVITEIFDEVWARVAAGGPTEMAAAAGARGLYGAGCRVLAGGWGFRRREDGGRSGPPHPDDRFGVPVRHVGAGAAKHGRVTPRLPRQGFRSGAHAVP